MADLFSKSFEDEERPGPAKAGPHSELKRRVYTVGELTGEIKQLFDKHFVEVWVEGEISNCRVWNTGHVYFTLKDDQSQLRAVMFRSALRYLKFKPEDGLHVIARGQVNVYEAKGEYQLVCAHMEPHGLGALQLAFEQLKKKLQAAGLFETSRKRVLPSLPRKIGVVTSLDGAALRDILKVLRRRHPNAHIVIRPARVQGEGAAGEIAVALRAIAKVPGVDVIIVGRGGGSIEDLWAFNEEVVARAIAASPVPVISAVGHETDVTIADFVADVRAATPSAAAEMVVAAKDEFTAKIDRLSHRLNAAMQQQVAIRHRRFQAIRLRLESRDLRRVAAALRARLGTGNARLMGLGDRAHKRSQSRLVALAGRLDTLSPLGVLGRGYAVCWNGDRTAIIRSAAAVNPGDRVVVTLHEGEIGCSVTDRVNDGQ